MKQEIYTKLKSEYPEYVSLDQLSKICKIAKRSAQYLIIHEVIPAIDTGKQTWRYQIALDDVIAYLCLRDKYGSMIPLGAVSSRGKNIVCSLKSFAQTVKQGEELEVIEYFKNTIADYNDVLTVEDIVSITGLNKSTILKMLKSGRIKSIMDRPKYLVPKQYLMEFLTSKRFYETRTRAEHFTEVLKGYEMWKARKSSR